MKQLWSSRFTNSVSDETLLYTETTAIDQPFIVHDIWGSLAHVLMLVQQQLIKASDGRAILTELLQLLEPALNGAVILDTKHEDVHLNIEARVIAVLGSEVGGRMHLARSRNDQVVTDDSVVVQGSFRRLLKASFILYGEHVGFRLSTWQ